jgi:hypothetical protein
MVLTWIIQRRFDYPFRGGQIGSQQVAMLLRNGWPLWIGISGHNAPEYAATQGLRQILQGNIAH